jgi:hypothetical protein
MPKIEQLFAFIAHEDEDPDDEGVVGVRMGGGDWMPLVGADPARVDALRPLAKMVARITGKRIVLALFKNRNNLEVIEK